MSGEQNESSRVESDEPYVPKTSGWPAWDWEAEKILKGIRHWVQKGGEEGDVAYSDFLRILDEFLSQLINWAEQRDFPELREWAGRGLADRLQFLLAQKDAWRSENDGFQKRWSEFRRRAHSPRSYLGWLAGDYLRKLTRQRMLAAVALSPPPGSKDNSPTLAVLAGYSQERISWLKKLSALLDFSPGSARQWAEVVFEMMEKDEDSILNSPQMQRCQTRDSKERRHSGEVKLYDFKSTIVKAVIRLASKPVGQIRGITRPAY